MPQISLPVIPKLTFTSVIDILAVAILIYQLLVIIRGRRAAYVLSGLWVLTIVYLIAMYAHLELLRSRAGRARAVHGDRADRDVPIGDAAIAGAHRAQPVAGIGRATGAARGGGRNSAGGGADVGDEDAAR